MAIKGKAAKRRRPNTNPEDGVRGEDRLSTLPDDTLIEIISHLPLSSAVVTGSLSCRWRGLWTNITSIDLSSRRRSGVRISNFSSVFCNIMMQIRSPRIHSFLLELDGSIIPDWKNIDYFWLLRICHRNVRELKLICSNYYPGQHKPILPCIIFQTRSLVSIELDETFGWEFPSDGEPIVLPNLKKLSLSFCGSQHNCIEKLIKTCSLLEDLSLKFKDEDKDCNPMIYSHQNLRRLSVQMDINYKIKIVINAPKLNYLNVYGRYDTIICLEEEPAALSEATIQLRNRGWLSDEEKGLMTKFYEAISNVVFLRLDVLVARYISNVFSNATRVTLNMRKCYYTEVVSSLVEMCPVLDVLIIKFGDVSSHCTWSLSPLKHDCVSTLRRVLKRTEIEYFLPGLCRPVSTFSALLEYLLFSSTIASEQFYFKLTGDKYRELGCVERKKRMELDLCKVFNELPLASIQASEIDFVGEYYKMSRRAGPKDREANRKVIHFSCLT